MTGLPTSIENYLREAGFSPTELLILRHLLDGEILTLREMAAKTGKSTGVLDQAMKKLISKNILSKKIVNDNPRYLLESVDAISAWVKKDMQQKRESLQRKHQDFESFIASLEIDRVRPEMKYFEGEIGITQAYMRLLEESGDFLCYLPVLHKEEEDPLRDFRVQYFRERHKRKIFLRIIAPDTPLARRFTSRDIFEYRETRCIPESDFPSSFEKIIAGNVVACFSHAEKKACFIHYPELAGTERKLFEVLWRRAGEKDGTATINQEVDQNRKMIVGIETKTFSALREFFLSKKSIFVLVVLGIASACITAGLFFHTSAINLQRIKEQVQSVAATGALQIAASDLEKLQTENDWKKPEWGKVVNQLKEIRMNNENIVFVYILRKNQTDPNTIEFIADSHSINPYANVDEDPMNDVDVGEAEGSSLLAWPGQPYEDAPQVVFHGFLSPTTSDGYYTDKWGTFISGYAPIRDADGNGIAVLAVDMGISKLHEFNSQSFAPFLSFAGFFVLFIAIRLAAFHRSLIKEFSRFCKPLENRFFR